MKVLVVIPARFASTRFPGKPLVKIGNRSMIQRVYEQALKIKGYDTDIIVATDDIRIRNEVNSFGGKICMTSDQHSNGTSRCFEAALKQEKNYDVLLNIQGDEPFANPVPLEKLIALFADSQIKIASLMSEIQNVDEIQNPNRVKVVTDISGNALYFSRSVIPYQRGEMNSGYFKHIGIYGFAFKTISGLLKLDKSDLELTEELEQLGWMYHGYQIRMLETDDQGVSVDVPGDLERVEKYLKSNPNFL